MIKCQVCGYDNPDSAKQCLNCGSPIEAAAIGEAIDDISGEATVLIGMKVPKAPTPPPSYAASPASAPPPPSQSYPPPPPISAPTPKPVSSSPPPFPATSAPFNQSSAPPPPALPVTRGKFVIPGAEKYNVLSIVSISTGGLALILCCCYLWVPFSIGAMVTGFLARNQIKQTGEQGDTLALVGMILGAIAFVVYLVLSILGVALGALGNMSGG